MPEQYIDSVIAYLKTVQGGGRAVSVLGIFQVFQAEVKALIDAAKKKRDAAAPEPTVVEPATEPAAGEIVEASAEAVEAPTEAETAAQPESVVDEEAITKYNAAKERAQKLLKAMGAR